MTQIEQRVCLEHMAWVESDNRFQRSARLLQCRWREDKGYDAGLRRPGGDERLGSRLRMPDAEERLWNYLTPAIGALVRREVDRNKGVKDRRWKKVYGYPRIFDDLLSSQPLCFNSFGEMASHIDIATAFARRLWPDVLAEVSAVEFEWSPGRQDPQFLSNGTAFDVFIDGIGPSGGRAFVAIEMKYHENLRARRPEWKDRYAEVAAASGAFDNEPRLLWQGHWQLWLDHLLALSMLLAGGWEAGRFVLMYPMANTICADAAARYRAQLTHQGAATFATRTLEDAHAVLRHLDAGPWVDDLWHRYLDFDRARHLLGGAAV